MKRIGISISHEASASLEHRARRRGISKSAVAREAIDAYLGIGAGAPRSLPFIGIGTSGQHDVARRVEEILAAEWADHILGESKS